MTGEAHGLSLAQRRIWFAEQRGDAAATYVIESSSWLTGPLDRDRLDAALEALVRLHPLLGMGVAPDADGRPWLSAVRTRPQAERVDAEGRTRAMRKAEAQRIAETAVATPFEVAGGPLLRPVLIRLSADEHLLVVAYHHLLGDAISSRIIRRDLMRLYAAGRYPEAGAAGSCGDGLQVDLAGEQAEDGSAEQRAADAATTARRLAGSPPGSTFRPTGSRAGHTSPRANWCQAVVDDDLIEGVARLARSCRASPFVVHLTALHLLVQRYSGQDQTLVGFMTGNRSAARRESVGLHAQTLVSRLDGSDRTGRGAITQVRTDLVDAVRCEKAHLEDVLQLLPEYGSRAGNPFFQCFLSYIDLGPEIIAEDLTATPAIVPLRFAWLDAELRIYVCKGGDTHVALRCPADLFDVEGIDQLLWHYVQILRSLTADPDTPAATLEVMTAQESARVLELGTGAPSTAYGTVAALLADRLAVAPSDNVAVAFADHHLTFGELRLRAHRVADYLAARGACAGHVVAVRTPRSLDLVVAVAGVLLAGAAVVLVDAELPAGRQDIMIANADPVVVLTDSEPSGVHRSRKQDEHNGSWAFVTVADAVREGGRPDTPPRTPAATDLAYVLYTSGSTGTPKAVGNTQAGLVNRIAWMQDYYAIGPGDSVLHKTPISFDVSVWELIWPLVAGARMVVARPGGHRDPEYLGNLIRRAGVTVVHFVPSMLAAFLAAGQAREPLPLRHVILSGESLKSSLAGELLTSCPAEVHNLYGPTEAAIDVTSFTCRPENIGAAVPIGLPTPGTRVHVLNRAGRPQPPGAIGELHLGGIQLAAGYLGQEQLTAERFGPHLAGSDERFYRTGDLGLMRRDGVLEYIGRVDRQIKIRGYRIEPGEIEVALERIDGVRQAAVIAPERNGARELVAFVHAEVGSTTVSRGPRVADARVIAAQLTTFLPEYMVPSRFHMVESLPTSTSGKMDYARLLDEDARITTEAGTRAESGTLSDTRTAPPNEVSQLLLHIMRTVVQRADLGIDDSFFACGGDSIRSLEVVAQARSVGLALSVEDVFLHPTARQLAAVVGRSSGRDEPPPDPFSLVDAHVHAQLPETVEDAYPLSAALRGLVVESSRPGRYRPYLTSLRLGGEFDAGRFGRACAETLRRHPVLRSSLWRMGAAEEPIQVVHRDVSIPVDVQDLRGRGSARQQQDFDGWFAAEWARTFDWYQPPLLRVTVHVLGDADFRLTLSEPFLDGMSVATFLTELLDRYLGLSVPEAVVDVWPTFLRQEQVALTRSAQAWRELLQGAPDTSIPGLAAEADPAAVSSIDVHFPTEIANALDTVNRQTGLPTKALLLAAHTRVLAVLSHQREVVTAVLNSERPATPGGVDGVGMFINANAFPVSVGHGSWLDLAQRLHDLEKRMMPHRGFPFSEVRRQGMVGQVHALFNYTRFRSYENRARTDELRILDRRATDQTYFPLTAQFMARGDALTLSLEFFGTEVRLDQRQAIASMYRVAVSELALTPYGSHEHIGLATRSQQAVVDGEPAGPGGALGPVFLRTAGEHPLRVAVRTPDGAWTFTQVREMAERLVDALRSAGAEPGDVIGIQLPRSAATAVAHLGVLLLGGVCLPIDPALPLARRRHMISNSRCRLVVTTAASDLADVVTTLVADTVCTDQCVPPAAEIRAERQPDDPAYIVFTSGSTGTPKGVLLSHRSILNRLRWGWRCAPLTARDVLAVRTPAAFVDAIAEMLGGLLGGATSYLVPEEDRSPVELLKHLERAGATRVTMVPTLLEQFLESGEDLRTRVPSLNCWQLSGEPLSLALVRRLRAYFPSAQIINLYGCTEVTADATAHWVRGDEEGVTAPVGVPIDGCTVMVMDPWGHAVPTGITGEVAVGGVPMSVGYLTSPDVHEAPDVHEEESRWFRTGDLGVLDFDGSLHCRGRRDRQFKVRGVRLESAEIEAALGSLPGVARAVVVPDERGLTAFVVAPDGDRAVEVAAMRQAVIDALPAAAVPTSFAVVATLPLTPSGKVDYAGLRDLGTPLKSPTRGGEPRTLVQRELAALWRTHLRVEVVALESDFFELGGHSLHAVMLVADLRDRMGVDLGVGDVFHSPRLADQAELVRRELLRQAAEDDLRGSDDGPPS
ncbi:non-ribosomal peptide synthetase [Pseudonocardia broussonetiae]|uniref:Amino acid adenylation domain-containing protein n=1 Tax=Pseudonocardia broussonetiae TaxID=2736640 RepID=A0A6M6JF87_9PSEU|nr:non-ribosomal peptide synthetase [Pseudonocardia broussonetiae]QJY45730.1 amino acid adenylation domain-containing protein [Pseudonocardia broussonetiae]